MRLDERKARDLFNRLLRADLKDLRDRLVYAIREAERASTDADGFPSSASGAESSGGGPAIRVLDEHGELDTVEVTSVEHAAFARLEDSRRHEWAVRAFLALDRMVGELDTIDSELRHFERARVAVEKPKRCWACARVGVDAVPDHFCDPGGNLGQRVDVCNACYHYIKRTGGPPPVGVVKARAS